MVDGGIGDVGGGGDAGVDGAEVSFSWCRAALSLPREGKQGLSELA